MACLAALTAAVFSTPAGGQTGPPPERGKALVEAKCAACHATGRAGQSRDPKAPTFKQINAKYDVTLLAEAMAEGLVVGHSGMPEFVFEPAEIDAIIRYMKWLGRP